jgi:hypothetical protein
MPRVQPLVSGPRPSPRASWQGRGSPGRTHTQRTVDLTWLQTQTTEERWVGDIEVEVRRLASRVSQ